MKKERHTLSLRRIILIVFSVAMLVLVVCYGLFVFTGWINSARAMAKAMAEGINDSIYDKVRSFIYSTRHINEMNYGIIENDILNLADETQRTRFFTGILEAHDSHIYSIGYGTENGEYYGARRNENGDTEAFGNNADTGWSTWYYSVNEDKTVGSIVKKTEKFDPRTRAWYIEAAEAAGPVFSQVYKHFVMDDLALSAAWPIYGETGELRGVLETHILPPEITTYLESAVERYNGAALIIEKGTGILISNSQDIENYSILEDGTVKHSTVADVENADIRRAFEFYETHGSLPGIFEGEDGRYFVTVKELEYDGLNWIIVSAIPESLFMSDVGESMRWSAIMSVLFLLLSILIYHLLTKKYLKPMQSLLQVSGELASGNLSRRVTIVRNDEIGLISKSFNSVADKMQSHIENLETAVQERTAELQSAYLSLEASKDDLRLILDSAAEAIFGIDLDGNCTFCNRSCAKILGYGDSSELLGRNMHRLIHHTSKEGSPIDIGECRIIGSLVNGTGTHVDDEVFWRSDGTSFDVEYFSYPQIKNGELIGAVITFMDVSDRKKKEAEIHYLSCYDPLTGLNNRRCFDERLPAFDIPGNLPLSVIFADINGLKMTNDIFGHSAGDMLIEKSAEILQQVCRKEDLAARTGGDEFIILLPNTGREEAGRIADRIRAGFSDARVEAIKCSISLGLDTKEDTGQSINDITANAENEMYRDKTINRKSINKDIIDTIIKTLHARSPREKEHSIAVGKLCAALGAAMQLSQNEISKLQRAGYLHDIGKITLDDSILRKDALAEEEYENMQQHTVVGYRILNLFDDTLDLAEYIYGHHERWDGTGYPRGLKGEQIPLISRIISITETYDRVRRRSDLSGKDRDLAALDTVRESAGTQFDSHIVEVFARMIESGAAPL